MKVDYCVSCRKPFQFNPDAPPPRIQLDGETGPLCLSCIALVNEGLAENGLKPIVALQETSRWKN